MDEDWGYTMVHHGTPISGNPHLKQNVVPSVEPEEPEIVPQIGRRFVLKKAMQVPWQAMGDFMVIQPTGSVGLSTICFGKVLPQVK